MLQNLLRYILIGTGLILTTAIVLIAGAWFSVNWYSGAETVAVHCKDNTPVIERGETLSVMSYNVQYMAGKNYFFFYDGGTDTKPSREDVSWTIQEVAKLIRRENPDIVLLQEVNNVGDSRTHHRDQLSELQSALHDAAFPCHASAPYWHAPFVPHPKIFGGVSMQLTTLSRFKIDTALRHPLPVKPQHWLLQRFYFQRAILETQLSNTNGTSIALLNTHFDAWTGGTDLADKQIAAVINRLEQLSDEQTPWIIGGDFNSLPPDNGYQWHKLPNREKHSYNTESAVKPLYERYQSIPQLALLRADNTRSNWYTYFSNHPELTEPDRTIDYLFFSHDWQAASARVVQGHTRALSDHLPLTASLALRKN